MAALNHLVLQGINRNTSPILLKLGELELAVNCVSERVGQLKKREGYTQILNVPDASEILSLIPFRRGSTFKLIMINAAGKLYSADPINDATWGTAILTGLSTTARWQATYLSGNLFLGNGAVVYKTTDGVAFTTVAGAPLAKYWDTLFQRVYCSGVDASPSTLFWSATGDGTDWSEPAGSSSTDVDEDDGGNIKQIKKVNDRMVIWKNEQMKRWDDDNMVTIPASSGLDAPYSLIGVDGNAIGLDREALRVYDGNYPNPVSTKIEDIIKNIDLSTPDRICAAVMDDMYYLSIGNLSDPSLSNVWIVYDYNKDSFYLFSLADLATAMTRYRDADNKQYLFFGGTDGKVYQMFDSEQDDGEKITMEVHSHWLTPSGLQNTFIARRIMLFGENVDEFFVEAMKNGDEDFKPMGKTIEMIDQVGLKKLGRNQRAIKVKITHTRDGQPSLNGFIINYGTVGKRAKS